MHSAAALVVGILFLYEYLLLLHLASTSEAAEPCHVDPESGGWCTPRLPPSPSHLDLLAIAVASEISWRHALPQYKPGCYSCLMFGREIRTAWMRTGKKRNSLYASPFSLPSHFQTFNRARKRQISTKTTVRKRNSELLACLISYLIS